MTSCVVCGAELGAVALDDHVHRDHPEVVEAYHRWAVITRAALSEPTIARYLGLLRMQRIRLQPVDTDYRPVGDAVVVRVDTTTGWGWCPLCRVASEPFDLIGHFGFSGRHPELFGPQVHGFDAEVLPQPFFGA